MFRPSVHGQLGLLPSVRSSFFQEETNMPRLPPRLRGQFDTFAQWFWWRVIRLRAEEEGDEVPEWLADFTFTTQTYTLDGDSALLSDNFENTMDWAGSTDPWPEGTVNGTGAVGATFPTLKGPLLALLQAPEGFTVLVEAVCDPVSAGFKIHCGPDAVPDLQPLVALEFGVTIMLSFAIDGTDVVAGETKRVAWTYVPGDRSSMSVDGRPIVTISGADLTLTTIALSINNGTTLKLLRIKAPVADVDLPALSSA
jgi:hypothetical protein